MENLLAMPVRPIEVMIAKIVPYMLIGYVQVAADPRRLGGVLPIADPRLAAAAARRARPVHRQQSRARRHLLDRRGQPDAGDADGAVHADAVVPAVRLHVPVPRHAAAGRSAIGEIFPTTHAMRIVRGMLLKGNGWSEIAPDLWPMALFTVCVTAFAVWAYRETLD